MTSQLRFVSNFIRTIVVKGGQEYIASRRHWGDFKRKYNDLKKQGKI